jgi:thiol-disulfide isomerase/thioredoxin
MSIRSSLACLAFAGLASFGPVPSLAAHSLAVAPREDPAAPTVQLMVGDAAPALTVKKFVKGEEVREFKAGQVYVVEFWATWCGPCKVTIPHLTEMQQKYGSKVRIIGVSVSEADQGLVEPFVAEWGAKMEYTVAMDDVPEGDARGRNGKMNLAWMKASGRGGIPSAFIVGADGKIAWIGHPMDKMEQTLDAIVAGKFDLAAATREYKQAKEAEAKMQPLRAEFSKAMKAQDAVAAVAAVDKMLELDPQSIDLGLTKLNVLLNLAKQHDVAYAYAAKLVDGAAKDSANGLNAVAWMLVDPDAKLEKPDLKLALRAASRAVELVKDSEPLKASVLDTLARVYFAMGDATKARETQEKAIELAPEQQKEQLRGALEEYKKASVKG